MKKTIAMILAAMLCLSVMLPLRSEAVTYGGWQIVAGAGQTALVDTEGNLWMCGSNLFGELGNGTVQSENIPIKVMTSVKDVSCGSGYTAAVKKDGTLWTWGCGNNGRLGNGGRYDYTLSDESVAVTHCMTKPMKIMDNVKMVSCGACHGGAVRTDGTLWMWGDVAYIGNGVMGNEKDINGFKLPIQTTPVKVMDDVREVSCGEYVTAVIRTDGSLWIWQKDVESGGSAINPIPPVAKKMMNDVRMVSCGALHVGIVKNDNSLWMCGYNNYGQIGDGTHNSALNPIKVMDGVKQVSLGRSNATVALKVDGELYIWGRNQRHSLGLGKGNEKEFLRPVKLMGEVTDVSWGDNYGIALKKNGKMWVWGSNSSGQLANRGVGDGVIYGNGVTPFHYFSVPTEIDLMKEAYEERPSAWAQAEVEEAIEKTLVSEENQYGYRRPISRVRAAQIVGRMIECSYRNSLDVMARRQGKETMVVTFVDTSDEYVRWLCILGIVKGVGQGRFNPDGTLTRAEMAAMVNRAAELLGHSTGGYRHNFVDVSGHWVDAELGWPVYARIIQGVGNNRFNPDGKLTTEQAIVIAYRAFKMLYVG